MKIISSPKQFRSIVPIKDTSSIGFVPTMGALHEGHLSLIKRSKVENDLTVVSIFVNPTQFLQGEDFEKYPQTFDQDKELCESLGVDYLFFPHKDDIYTKDEILIKAPQYKGFILEGERRPGHFDGMLQIVLKLFHIVKPTRAYFGKKDAQQLLLIQQMVQNLFLDITIVPCEIIREANGLAMSSRNSYLTSSQKTQASAIYQSLQKAQTMIENGETNVQSLCDTIKENLLKNNIQQIEYIHIIKRDFSFLDFVEWGNSIILVAVKIEDTRLIDNCWI